MCEDTADATFVIDYLRKQKRLNKINVVQSSPEPADHYPSPPVPNELRRDFVDYLINMMECPAAVRTYLCKAHSLHKVPVFSDDANSQIASRWVHFDPLPFH